MFNAPNSAIFYVNTFSLITVITVVIVSVCILEFTLARKGAKLAKRFPGPKGHLLVGAGLQFLWRNQFLVFKDLLKEYGFPFTMRVGGRFMYMTNKPSEIKVILNHPNLVEKISLYKHFKPVFGNSLLTAPAELWKKNRKCLSKSFSQSILDGFVPIFYEKSKILVRILENEWKLESLDISDKLSKYTFDSFCESAIGVNLNIQRTTTNKFVEWVDRLQAAITRRFFAPWYYYDFIYYLSPEGRQFANEKNEAHEYMLKVIKERRKISKSTKELNLGNSGVEESSKKKALADLMLAFTDEGQFVDEEITQELLLFTSAATDTSSFSMSFTCLLLGMNPEVQELAYEEILEVVGKTHPIQCTDLPKMKYLERVIHESLRILPVVPMFGRTSTADIEIGEIVIPNNIEVMISVMGVHRSEKIWPNPLKFDPDRFLKEEITKRPAYCYIPFSGGPRNCLGMKYAMMLMKTNLANLIRHFQFTSYYKNIEDLPLISHIVLRLENHKYCKVTPRLD